MILCNGLNKTSCDSFSQLGKVKRIDTRRT